MEPEKGSAIEAYIKENFDGCNIKKHERDFTHYYQISDDQGVFELKISREFISDNQADEIIGKFQKWNIQKLMRECEDKSIEITNSGYK